MPQSLTSLLTSAGLGIGAGINAYATLLVFGILARWHPANFPSEPVRFFSSTPVLIVLGLLYVVEFLADKIPAIDHAWDLLHTFIRPVAGALVAWSAASQHGMPEGLVVIAAVIGGGAALGAHATKATVRIASTATTGGIANPFLSIAEDLFAFANAIVAMLLPWLLLVLLAFLLLGWLLIRRRRSRAPAKGQA